MAVREGGVTADEARERLLAKHLRYNQSGKGRQRNKRYENAHPERKLRWEAARNALRRDQV